MTATLDLTPTAAAEDGSRSSRFAGKGGAYSLLVSGALVFVSLLMIPWDNVGTAGYVEFNREHATAAAWAAVVLHFGFLLLVPGALALARAARAATPRLSVAASVLAWLGSGLSGIVVVDYYDIVLSRELPADQAVELIDATTEVWQGALIAVPSMLGLLLGTILAAVAARRARLVPTAAVGMLAVGWVVFIAGADYIVPAAIGTGLMAASTAWMGARLLRH